MRFRSRVLCVRGPGQVRRGFCIGAVLCFAAALAGLAVLASGSAGAAPEEQEYSAYEDAGKPVVSFVLSDPENVEEFQREFDLSDAEIEGVLAATRAENEALARTYAESEKVLDESRSLSPEQKRQKVEASSYDEEVRASVGETKKGIQNMLPEDRVADLEAWVNEQWQQAVGEFKAQAAAEEPLYRSTQRAASGRTFKVFTTQYIGYTNYEMALPHRKLKFRGGYKAVVSFKNRSARIPVKEVGPWNTYDNYWDPRSKRTMWKNLKRGVPEAQAAYYSNYNNGKDEFGRKVLNPAGADLTPAAARQVGLRKYQNAWIQVRMPWLKQ